MMRKLFFALLLILSGAVSGVECRKHTQTFVGRAERGEPFRLQNRYTGYVITFRYTNPTPSQPPFVLIGMPQPVNVTGFSRRDFFNFQVNGIDSRKLEPKKYEIFHQNGEAGVEILYNFNGIGICLRFSVSDASPFLKLQLRRAAGTPADAVKSLRVEFNILPNASGRKSHSYAREIVSPQHVYRGKPGVRRQRRKLAAGDSPLILQDSRYQYQADTEPESNGPVLLAPDWKNILSGFAVFGTHQNMNLFFQLDPKAGSWSFGLLDSELKRNNRQFLQFIRNDLGVF